jgi:para-nitrobenzyl esterase
LRQKVGKIFSDFSMGSIAEMQYERNEIDKLQQIPWREYIDIADRSVVKMSDEAKRLNIARGGFSPVGDGEYMNGGAFFADSNHFSADIPVIICSTFNEQSPSRTDAKLEGITLAEIEEKIKPRFGDKSALIVDAYVKNFPKAKPIEIWSMILSNRKNAVAIADAKVSQKKAPVYLAWFGWQPPLFDGRMRAFHCDDICFWFYNTDLMLTHTGGGKRPRSLSEKMSKSLKKGGDLIISGILNLDSDKVVSSANQNGLTLVNKLVEDEWAAFHFVKGNNE